MRAAVVLLLALGLAGCGLADCAFDLAYHACAAPPRVPEDDAICRAYGLKPGTPDYARCRHAKAHERKLTQDETSDGFLRNPILPDIH
jgi:hypothetical protein